MNDEDAKPEDIPVVSCFGCGKRVFCYIDEHGKAWRPSWWTFDGEASRVGVCATCAPKKETD